MDLMQGVLAYIAYLLLYGVQTDSGSSGNGQQQQAKNDAEA